MLSTPHEPLSAPADPKPKLRGWFHLGMTPLVVVGGIVLITLAPTTATRIGSAVWLFGAAMLFGTSAAYHLGNWSVPTKAALRRWDHANIFVFIAATYTPISLALLPQPQVMLTLIWTIAISGLLVRVFWQQAPRWLDVAYYMMLGWAGLWWLPQFWTNGSPTVVILILAGGLVYSVGAVVYGRKRPDPSPQWFGFHEIFHACTVVAALFHFAAIAVAIFG